MRGPVHYSRLALRKVRMLTVSRPVIGPAASAWKCSINGRPVKVCDVGQIRNWIEHK